MATYDNNRKIALAVMTHPDDAEFSCAGTLALLKEKGWQIEIATMTAGDCGSIDLSREEISDIRVKEATAAAKLIGANYSCLKLNDIFLMYDKPTLLKAITLVRRIRPNIVFTMSPSCYLIEHETTSRLVQTACFACGIKNIETKDFPPFQYTPYLYYIDPMEGKDILGKNINPTTIVDITNVMPIKEQMLKCHSSQREWLAKHHGMDEYIMAMKEMSSKRGKQISTSYAEGFRQHLGHSFPQDNILYEELDGQVFEFKLKEGSIYPRL